MKDLREKTLWRQAGRILPVIAAALPFLLVPALAAGGGNEYAQNAVTWLLDAVYWIALLIIVFQLAKCVVARNLTAALGLILSGALVVVLITKPAILVSLGEKLLAILGIGA